MMKKAAYLTVFLLLISSVSALNDLNITIDSGGLDICLVADRLNDSAVCNGDGDLVLSGTEDHYLYFIPKKATGTGVTKRQTVTSLFTQPLNMFFTSGVFIMLIATLFVIYIFYRFVRK